MTELNQMESHRELRYGVVSKQGGRPYNEDCCVVRDYSLRRNPKYLCFMAMADGMGGHQAGDVASNLAVQMLERYTAPAVFSDTHEFEEKVEKLIWNSFSVANSHIHDLGLANSEHEGMGTTLTCALVDYQYAFIGHVGDTRAYSISSAGITQVTEDHSVVGKMVADGVLTELEAKKHSKRNILTRAIGPEMNVEIDILKVPINAGDILFMCCDGCYATVTNGEIYQIFVTEVDLQSACNRLVDLAISRGSEDNVSAVAWRMPLEEALPAAIRRGASKHAGAKPRGRSTPWWAVTLLALLILCVGFGIGWGIGAIFFKRSTTPGVGVVTNNSGTASSSGTVSGQHPTSATGPAESTAFKPGTLVKISLSSGQYILRDSPSPNGLKVAELPNGCKLKVISTGPTRDASGWVWYQVEVTDQTTPAKGKKGYARLQYIEAY